MTALIQVDVAGEAAGTPGVSREFTYAKIATTPPLVTLSIPGGGITQYYWEILAQPTGASATLSSQTVASPTFTPTVTIDGTYLIQCTVNGGADYGRVCLAFSTQNLALRKPAPGEQDEFSSTRGWEAALETIIDTVDEGSGAVASRKTKVIDYVDATAVPPTEVLGDRYILDNTGAPHANWDGASQLDIVQFDGTSWIAETPEEGWVVFVDSLNVDALYVDDGAGSWEFRSTEMCTADEAIAIGDAVCGTLAAGNDNRVNKANADSTGTDRQYCIGFAATVAAGAGSSVKVVSDKLVTVTCPAGESWTKGQTIFLDDVAGQVSNVVPTTSGDVIQEVGVAAVTTSTGSSRTMFVRLGPVIPII